MRLLRLIVVMAFILAVGWETANAAPPAPPGFESTKVFVGPSTTSAVGGCLGVFQEGITCAVMASESPGFIQMQMNPTSDPIVRIVSATIMLPMSTPTSRFADESYVTSGPAATSGVLDTSSSSTATMWKLLPPLPHIADSKLQTQGPYTYIADTSTGNVSVLNARDLTVVTTVAVGKSKSPTAVAIDPQGRYVYVMNSGDNTVSVIEAPAHRVIDTTIAIGAQPTAIAIHPTGKFLYVATSQRQGEIVVVDTRSRQKVASISLTANANRLVVSPDGAQLYALNGRTDDLFVIDTAQNSVTRTHRVNSLPVKDMAMDPSGKTVYLLCGSDTVVQLYTLDTASQLIAATAFTASGAPLGLAVNPTQPRLYLAYTSGTEATLAVLDTATLHQATVPSTVPFPSQLPGIGIDFYGRIYSAGSMVIDPTQVNVGQALGVVGTTPAISGLVSGPVLASVITPDVAMLDFGGTTLGKTTERTMTLTNTGALPLMIHDVSLSSEVWSVAAALLPSEFRIMGDTCTAQTLAPDAQCAINVAYTPGILHAVATQLVINSDSASPVAPIKLNGLGQQASVTELAISSAPAASESTPASEPSQGSQGGGGAFSPIGIVAMMVWIAFGAARRRLDAHTGRRVRDLTELTGI